MVNHSTLELDWAHDIDHARDTKFLAKKHNLEVKLLQEFGPAGGNPLYLFTGSHRNLVNLIKDYTQENEDDMEMYEESIKEG
jgi:hypothetical protein